MDSHDLGQAGAPNGASAIDIAFDSHGDRLIGISLWNALLILVTLGLYSSWAKTEVRRRLWSFIRINGEPLRYTGTGRELFTGLMVAMVVIVLPALIGAVAVAFLFPNNTSALSTYQAALYAVFFLLIGGAIYRAWRYRLSRTEWRGIRGALSGNATRYGWTYFWTIAGPLAAIAGAAGLAAFISAPEVGGVILLLGMIAGFWVMPWRANKLRAIMTNDARFGDHSFTYDGTSAPLYRAYFTAWLGCGLALVMAIVGTAWIAFRAGISMPTDMQSLTIPPATVLAAIVGIWLAALLAAAILTSSYRAQQLQHFARHTHLGTATFRSDVSGYGLMWVTVTNLALRFLAIVAAIAAAAFLVNALGFIERGAVPAGDIPIEGQPSAFRLADLANAAITIACLVLATTVAATFANYRWTRYLMSRLKLDGTVDLAAILQSAAAEQRRGEGLAQVFDIDAF